MATVVRRSAEIGDTRLARRPFPQPGPAPVDRLSALAFQGVSGDPVSNVANAIHGRSPFTPGQGDVPPYVVLPSGVPAFDFNSGTMPSGANPALYISGTGRPTIRTQVMVGRILRLGTTPSGNAQHSYGHLIRPATAGWGGLYIGNAGTSIEGQLCAVGSATANSIFGPQVEVGANSGLHFFAAVYNGSGSFVQYDNSITDGVLDTSASTIFLAGYTQSGIRFQAVEVAQWDVALTKTQIENLRQHYATLLQF